MDIPDADIFISRHPIINHVRRESHRTLKPAGKQGVLLRIPLPRNLELL